HAKEGIRVPLVTGVQPCALPIWPRVAPPLESGPPPAEPVDYYAMLGLTAEHLVPVLIAPVGKFQLGDGRAAMAAVDRLGYAGNRSEERRVGKGCRCRWRAGDTEG